MTAITTALGRAETNSDPDATGRSQPSESGLGPKARRRSWNIEITKRRVPRPEFMHFCRQLSVFIRAGMPITEGLELTAARSHSRQLRSIAGEIATALRGGSSFASAAAAHPEAFAPYQVGMLQSAEVTGRLDTVLDQIADYVERDAEARSRLVGALLYPGVVFLAAIITVVVMAVFVLPRFETFFASFHARLPLVTRLLMDLCALFSKQWKVMLATVALVVAVVVAASRTKRGRDCAGLLMITLPGIGPLMTAVIAERVCRILSVMLRAGVLLGDALGIAAMATSNARYRVRLLGIRTQMLEGNGLAQPVAQAKLFDGPAEQLFRIGEATGTLDEQLARAASYYDRELDYRLKRFTALFEPAVIVFVGLVVGFVAIALISAIYGIYNQVRV